MQVWVHGFPLVGQTARLAARTEQQGFHGLLVADSQMLVADPYVELALAAPETSTLRLGVAVTNPVTRHPSVTAASIQTVHAESGGRAVLGFARGDSALRQIGERPAPLHVFAAALRDLSTYLGGADRGSTGRALQWLPEGLAVVPVDVAATGPRVIELGATLADRMTFNLGADVERLRWAIELARTKRRGAGLDHATLSLGAYVNVGCHPDESTAIESVRGSASIFVQFLAEGLTHGVPATDEDRAVARDIATSYAESSHGQSDAPQARALPDEFVRRFALVGTPDRLVARIVELQRLGLDRIVVVPASRDVDPAVTAASTQLFATEVLPNA